MNAQKLVEYIGKEEGVTAWMPQSDLYPHILTRVELSDEGKIVLTDGSIKQSQYHTLYDADSVFSSIQIGDYVGIFDEERERDTIYRVVSLHNNFTISVNDRQGVSSRIDFTEVSTVYPTLDKFAWVDVVLVSHETVVYNTKTLQKDKFQTEAHLLLKAGYKLVANTQNALHFVQEVHIFLQLFNWFGTDFSVKCSHIALPYYMNKNNYEVRIDGGFETNFDHTGLTKFLVKELNLTNTNALPSSLKNDWKPARTQFS